MSSASLMEVVESVDSNLSTSVEWFDLKLNRDLLDANFEGYKLSLDPFVQYKLSLSNNLKLDTYNYVESGESKNRVFVYQHLRLLGLQNLLIVNNFDDSNLYYFDSTSRLVKIVYKKPNLLPVRTIVPTNLQLNDAETMTNPERVNPTMKFISENRAIVFNGLDTLFLYEKDLTNKTEDPLIQENWMLMQRFKFDHLSEIFSSRSSILRDALQYESNKIHVLLMNVQESKENASKYDTLAHWLMFEISENNEWSLKRTRVLNCLNTVPDYMSFETNGQSIYLTGPSMIKFVHDSLKPIRNSVEEKSNKMNANDEKCEHLMMEKFYSWHQTNEEINMNVRLDDTTKIYKHEIDTQLDKNDIKVDIKFNSIDVLYKQTRLLSGILQSTVKPDESVWTLNTANKTIEISLVKSKPNDVWTSFLKNNDQYGEYQYSQDQPMDQETNAFLNKLTSDSLAKANESNTLFTLEQQLEECDGIVDDQMMANSDNSDEKLSMLRRLDGDSHQDTHKCYINENRYLFDVRLSASKSPALVLRHDVDGILWQPHRVSAPSPPQTIWLTHEHTFLAFGYVQASKQEAKYRSCSRDLSYSVIIDTQKHIYIYKQSSEKVQTQLKNRKTGQIVSHVAKQYLISLDSDQEIYGFYCSNDFLVVLLKEVCYVYKIIASN